MGGGGASTINSSILCTHDNEMLASVGDENIMAKVEGSGNNRLERISSTKEFPQLYALQSASRIR